MYLLDTDVVSVLRRPERHPQVARWLALYQTERFYVSVITFGELQRGVEVAQRTDPVFAQELVGWLNRILVDWQGRILLIDTAIARRWGSITAAIGNKSADLLLAATALEYDFTVVTRNVTDFEPTRVRIVYPFDE